MHGEVGQMERVGLDLASHHEAAGESPQVRTLLRLVDILISTTSLQAFAEEFLEELSEAMGASGIGLFLADAGGVLAPFTHTGLITSAALNALTGAEGLATAAARSSEFLRVIGEQCARHFPEDEPVPSELVAVPLRSNGHVVGVIVAATRRAGGFDEAATGLIRALDPARIAKAIDSMAALNVAILEGERAHARAAASRLLMSTADPQQRLELMAEQLSRVAGLSRCFILEVVDEAQELIAAHGATDSQISDARLVLQGHLTQPGLELEKVVETQRPTVISREDVLAGVPLAEAIDMHSSLVLPLVYGGQVAGVALLDEPGRVADFDVARIEAVESVADVAALATHSAQIQKRIAEKAAMERHRDRMSALHHILNTARIVLDEDELVTMLPRAISDVLGYDRVYMYLIRDGKFELGSGYFKRRDKDFEKFAARARKHPPKIGEPTIEVEVFRHGNAQIVESPPSDPRVIKQHQKLLQSKSMAVVPLWGKAEVNGILVADYKYQDLPISEEDIGLLSILGTGIGAALESVRLYQGARRDRDRLATLLANSEDAIMIVDRERRIVVFNSGSERLSGMKADQALGRSCQEVWRCRDEQGRSITEKSCPFMLHAGSRLSRKASYSEHVVLRADDAPVDVAVTYGFLRNPEGGVEQGMAIIRDLTEHKRWMREHYIANTLQEALLPEAPPAESGTDIGVFYESATTQAALGGDFYDFIALPDGRLCIVIGDVCGKGIDAAHYTAMTKYTLRAYLVEGCAPATIMARLNDTVTAQVGPGEFISTCFVLLDADRSRLTYCNAGHPRPLLRHGGDWTKLDKSGMVLGVVPGQWYEEETAPLGQGDTLLLYTDGLVETRKGPTVFGEERLMQFLERCRITAAQQFAERIYQRSATFAGGHLADDVAVVVVRT